MLPTPRFLLISPTVLQDKGLNALPCLSDVQGGGLARADEIARRFVNCVRDPDGFNFARAQDYGERHRVSSVILDPITGLPWNTRRSNDMAHLSQLLQFSMEPIPAGPGFVDELEPAVTVSQAANQFSNRLVGVRD